MKRKTLKRLVSTALAGTLALSLAAPALAAEESGGWSTEITATYQEIALAVTVPGEGSAIINPYGLPITLEDGVSIISEEQITTAATLVITNQSEVDLAVSVNGKVTPTDDVEIKDDGDDVNDPVGGNGDDKDDILKNVLVKFEIFAAPGVDAESEADPSVVDPMFAALKGDADVSLTLGVDADDADDTIILKKGNEGATQDGGAAFVRLSGEVAKKPTAGWTADDGFTANIIYTFEPSEYALPIELTAGTNGTALVKGGTTNTTVSFTLPNDVTLVDGKDPDWTSSDSNVTVTGNSTTKTQGDVALDAEFNTGSGTATISVRFEGSDGNTYKGSIDITYADS